MASQKGKAADKTKGAAGKIAKVRAGIPPLVRSDKQMGGKKSGASKLPTKPKAKETLRDGTKKASKKAR